MATQSFQFVMQQGPTPGKVIPLTQDEIAIGRDTNNTIVINDRGVSRHHALMRLQAGSYILQDLNATNGTFVNGERLEGERILRLGDRITLGEQVLLIFNGNGNGEQAGQATMVLSPATVRLDAQSIRSAVAQEAAPSKAEEHRLLFTRWFEELWNKKNYAITQELVDPDFTAHGAGGQDIKQGPNGVAELVRTWHIAFPDGHMTMDDIITEGEYSVIRMTFTGTHQGNFYGTPASGKPVKVTSIGIDRVVNGKITEGWGELDMLGLMQQVGAMPAPQPQPDMYEIEAAVSPERVLEAYDALASGDINRIRMYWADEMVWQVPGHNELSGWHYSLDGFLAFMAQVGELSGHSFNMQPIAGKVLVTGDYSVDLTRNRGRRNGQASKALDIEVAHVLRWRHGKIIAGKGAIFGDGTEEYDQFWSTSQDITPPSH
jgi:pSer/pThr/pTyr-binding forkhead associated (FHA) protein/predicted ester cyclase/ketosteroid isomerase-like protein